MKRARSVCLLLIALTGSACRGKEEAESKSSSPQPIRVKVAAVVKGSICEQLEASGETQALTVLRLASPVAGRITALAFRGLHMATHLRGLPPLSSRLRPLKPTMSCRACMRARHARSRISFFP